MRAVAKTMARAAIAVAIAAIVLAPAPAVGSDAFRVEYLDGAKGMVAPDENLFAAATAMIPGDEITGVVDVHNLSDETVALWFWAEDDADDIGGSMVSRAMLQVVNAATGEELYGGTLHPSGIPRPLSLGTYAPGERVELVWLISLPAELGNDYQGSTASVTWIFAAEEQCGAVSDESFDRLPPTGGALPIAPTAEDGVVVDAIAGTQAANEVDASVSHWASRSLLAQAGDNSPELPMLEIAVASAGILAALCRCLTGKGATVFEWRQLRVTEEDCAVGDFAA